MVYADGTTIQYAYDELGNRVTLRTSKSSDLQAAFAASPTSGPMPLTVAFTDQSTGSISSWSWNFGDGGSSTSQNPSHAFSSAGTFTVTLAVSNGSQSSSKSTLITVNSAGPTANFGASPISGSSPLAVQFTDNSTGTVTSWSWSFGDGGKSASRNPSHTYTSPGNYTPALTVTDPGGTSGPKSALITVSPPASGANFSAAPTIGTAPLTVGFTKNSTGIITSWSWDFGDGATISSENPTHTYEGANTYVATLTVRGPKGFSSSKTTSITVNPVIAPSASFSATPTSGAQPLAVSFTDSSTGTITGWSWNFGDGATSNSRNPVHTYTSARTYTATLVVTGPTGLTSANTTSITVTAVAPPTAGLSSTPTTGYAPLKVQFTDASTGAVTAWSQDFGDGSTSTQEYPSHTYLTAGTYTVSLTASGPGGSDTDTQTGFITVSTPSTYGIDEYTKLMLHFDGPNGSRTFTDSRRAPQKQ